MPQPPDRPVRIARRLLLHGGIAMALLVAFAAAMPFVRDYVEESVVAPATAPLVVFTQRPPWMTDPLAAQLAASLRPATARSVFDREVLVETHRRLEANPWIADVRQVRRVYGKGPGDTLEIDCDFRAPMALVHIGADFWFVDAQGVKLPERFAAADVPRLLYGADGRTNIRIIDGVRHAPPRDAGQKWSGDDLTAGLDLVQRLYDQPFAQDVIKVNVANFAGRVDAKEPQLVLMTKYNTEVRWGRPWGASDAFIEVPPERKLDYMRRVVAEFGRVDGRQRWIDIRFDKVTYPSPGGSEPGAAQADGNR